MANTFIDCNKVGRSKYQATWKIKHEKDMEAMSSKVILMMLKNQELRKFQRFKNQVLKNQDLRFKNQVSRIKIQG